MKPIIRTKPLILCALTVWATALGATVVQFMVPAHAACVAFSDIKVARCFW